MANTLQNALQSIIAKAAANPRAVMSSSMRDQVYAQIRGELKASSELDPGEASGIESEIVRHLRAAFVKASRASRPERAARLRDAWQSIADTLPAMRVSRQSSPFAIPAGWGRPLVESSVG